MVFQYCLYQLYYAIGIICSKEAYTGDMEHPVSATGPIFAEGGHFTMVTNLRYKTVLHLSIHFHKYIYTTSIIGISGKRRYVAQLI